MFTNTLSCPFVWHPRGFHTLGEIPHSGRLGLWKRKWEKKTTSTILPLSGNWGILHAREVEDPPKALCPLESLQGPLGGYLPRIPGFYSSLAHLLGPIQGLHFYELTDNARFPGVVPHPLSRPTLPLLSGFSLLHDFRTLNTLVTPNLQLEHLS